MSKPGRHKRILLLGFTGKMGSALMEVLQHDYFVIGKNSSDFNAANFGEVRQLVEDVHPQVVINTVAFIGIDPCEQEPEKAFILNALYPRFLAKLSRERGFLLAHFSTDAVFHDRKRGFYRESDKPQPLHVYGVTKYGGDCFIQTTANQFYIFRIPLLFGTTAKNTQFVEKMLQKIKEGQNVLRVSSDIISSPSYSFDIAYEVKRTLRSQREFGLYHLANEGRTSLYGLMSEIAKNLRCDITIKKAFHRDFPSIGIKNTCTPLKSEKIRPLRPWREAVKEYCLRLEEKDGQRKWI